MGAREDFMAVRRAARVLRSKENPSLLEGMVSALLHKASARGELSFIEMSRRSFYGEVIDVAWAVLETARPGGSAVGDANAIDTGKAEA